MCLLAISYQTLADCPLLVLANREELRARPASPPLIHDADPAIPAWLGGIDLTAGGTWLGVNRFGMIVAITNRRKSQLAPTLRSRGLLCRDMLACRNPTEALDAAKDEMRRHHFAGFNLLLLSRERGFVVEAADKVRLRALQPGIQIITNGTLNDSADDRIRRARAELDRLREQTADAAEFMARGKTICGLIAGGNEPAICLTGGNRGTVSSSIISLCDDLSRSEYIHAPGPPSDTAYNDYSDLLRTLLSMNTQ